MLKLALLLALPAALRMATVLAANAVTVPTIDPKSIDCLERGEWCVEELHNCPKLCGHDVARNSCVNATLAFECRCGNGSVPDLGAYKRTMPTYMCEAAYDQCVARHPGDAVEMNKCWNNRDCGILDPNHYRGEAYPLPPGMVARHEEETEGADSVLDVGVEDGETCDYS